MSSARNRPAALGSLLASSREAAARYAGTAVDHEQWRRIVGERIAARTEPGAKRGRELTVHVASASWAQELSLLVSEIVMRLKAAGVGVDAIRFRVKEIAARPREAAAIKPVYRRATLPPALAQQLHQVDDHELREAIAETAALWLALDERQRDAATDEARAKRRPSDREPPLTSTLPNVRTPPSAESQSARSARSSAPARAKRPSKP